MSRSDGRAADKPFSWTAASTSAAGGVEVLSWGATGGHYESRD